MVVGLSQGAWLKGFHVRRLGNEDLLKIITVFLQAWDVILVPSTTYQVVNFIFLGEAAQNGNALRDGRIGQVCGRYAHAGLKIVHNAE
jgi:hypothetical protein